MNYESDEINKSWKNINKNKKTNQQLRKRKRKVTWKEINEN